MKWSVVLTLASIFYIRSVLSRKCNDEILPCWHRFSKFTNVKHMHPCLNYNPCLCNNVTVDCSSQSLSFVPFLGPEYYRYLNLSNNSLRNISSHDFLHVSPKVEVIDLFDNGLVYLSPAAFYVLSKLKILLLGGSNHLSYRDLPTLLSIQGGVKLGLSCLGLKDMPLDTFHNASRSKTRTLDFSWNQIPSLNLSAFQPLRNILYLKFWHNQIYNLETGHLPSLKYLDLQHNRLFSFPKSCSSSGKSLFPQLTALTLDQNMIECIDDLVCLPKLNLLSLNYNKILIFPSDMFSITRFPSLTGLKLMQMEGKIESIQQFFVNNSKVGELYFMLNQVDFSRHEMQEDAFGGCFGLKILRIWGNNFGHMPDTKFQKLLDPVKESLVFLNLGEVQMNYITDKMFSGLKKLKTLQLQKNDFSRIPAGVFDQLLSLKCLSLDRNKITTISEATFSFQLRNRLKSLTLAGNPFICDCDILWFQRWMKTNYEIFTDFHSYSYSCANADNITLPDFVLNEQACMLGSDAAAFTISITCVFILFFLLFSLFFRFRWHVRLWLYEACRSRGRQQRRLLRERRRFKYDLFVSYAEENLGWVEHRLIPVLEGQWGLRLCIHQRDFLPGKHIVDNISDCVEDSERILLVFSPFFARSEWCQFELKLCQTCVMERDDVLVIVTLQTVGSRDMTGAMMAVLRTTTYIEWEDRDVEEGQGQDMFWERMRVAVEDTEGGI